MIIELKQSARHFAKGFIFGAAMWIAFGLFYMIFGG